ncbi:MAG: class I SAM-dependent methyltransferase [Stenotrophobium sp.]
MISPRTTARTSPISYGASADAWSGHLDTVRTLIRESGARSVLELGGGANPALPLDEVNQQGLDYTVLDISQVELDKAPAGYHKLQANLASPLTGLANQYDFVFSKMLAEHVSSGQVFHENVLRLLRPGGMAFHFFPTLYAPPFIANWLLPERLADWLLSLLSPRDRYQLGKFPAYYSWCRGPTQTHLRRLEAMGYEIHRYSGFFGHEPYYSRIPVVRTLHRLIVNFLLQHPTPWLTSFAYMVVRKAER